MSLIPLRICDSQFDAVLGKLQEVVDAGSVVPVVGEAVCGVVDGGDPRPVIPFSLFSGGVFADAGYLDGDTMLPVGGVVQLVDGCECCVDCNGGA